MISNIRINKDSDIALYQQLYENIRNIIEDNENLDGEKLPSIRALSKSLQINNVTVVNAYKQLESEGYIYKVPGSGTFVRKPVLNIDSSTVEEGDMELMISGIFPLLKDSIDFATVSPTPELFPIKEFKQSLIEVLDRDKGMAFLYPEITGYGPLRESISKFINDNYSITVNKEQILITSGGQQGLDIISKTLVNQGDTILVENPTYPGAYSAFKSRGAKIVGLPLEDDGINLDLLKGYVKRYNPKFIYLMPNYQSPTTISYTNDKKKEILRLAKEYNFYIIEDDFLTDLSFQGNKRLPMKTLDRNDNVIFIKSFSKIFMPGVRIGFMTIPGKLFKDLIKAKHSTDISSSGYLQRAFDLYLRKDLWKSHMDTIINDYYDKYMLMKEELDQLTHYGLSYKDPKGGLSIWVKLPKSWDSMKLYEECSKRKLAIVPGKVFFIDNDSFDNYIRLSFSAVTQEEIKKGMNILREILSHSKLDKIDTYMPFL